MPTYRLTTPGSPDELLEADSARVEGIHTVLRGTACVMGQPREVVVRRVPRSVRVEEVHRPAHRDQSPRAAGLHRADRDGRSTTT